jgi:DNA-binding CsgD family transcriptional regulator
MRTTKLSLDLDSLLELKAELGTNEAVADHLGVSLRTLRRYLRRNGWNLPKKTNDYRSHWSKMAKWFRENPNVELPRNYSEIAEITGISLAAVTNYCSRRKAKARELFAKHLEGYVRAKGSLAGIPVHKIERLRLKPIDKYTFAAYVNVITKDKRTFTDCIPEKEIIAYDNTRREV